MPGLNPVILIQMMHQYADYETGRRTFSFMKNNRMRVHKETEEEAARRRSTLSKPMRDAVVGGMFNLSRTEAARQISAGNVSINYQESLKTDFAVKENDIVSLRGAGKGRVTGTGGTSRKGRLFVYAEIYQ